jgi:hypothetical protein
MLTIGTGGAIRLQDVANAYSNTINAQVWSANYRSGTVLDSNGSLNFGVSGNNASGFVFRWLSNNGTTIDYSSDSSELMRLTKGGFLGLGTTAPAYKLDVVGSIRSSAGGFVFPDGTILTTANPTVTSGINQITQSNNSVGIGTTAPGAKLDVEGGGIISNGAIYLNSGSVNTGNTSFILSNSLGGETYAITAGIPNVTQTGFSINELAGYTYGAGIQTISTPIFTINNGSIGIGTTTPGAKLEVDGTLKLTGNSGASITFADGTTQSTAYTGVVCGGDYAESVDVTGDRTKYEPGDVLVIDPSAPGRFLKSNQPYSRLVTGIYSTKPGTVGRRQSTSKSPDEVPMAMMGIVPTKVTAENGPIKIGDLLVASSTLGRAMKGTEDSKMLGAVIGKALGNLDSGTGVIEVVVTLQ